MYYLFRVCGQGIDKADEERKLAFSWTVDASFKNEKPDERVAS